MSVTNLQKESAGDIKAPKTVGVTGSTGSSARRLQRDHYDDHGGQEQAGHDLYQGSCARKGSDPPRAERFRQIAGQKPTDDPACIKSPHARRGEHTTTQVARMVLLNVALIAVGLVGCVSASPTWSPGAPDAPTVEHYTLAMKAIEAKSQYDAQAAFYLLRSDVMRMRTNIVHLQAALAILYSVSNAVDKEDWATAQRGALALQASYGKH